MNCKLIYKQKKKGKQFKRLMSKMTHKSFAEWIKKY